LAIVAGRYSLQRPAFGAVLECIEVLRGTRKTLPRACVVLASTPGQPEIEPPENLIALHELDQVTDRMAGKTS
jgi:hypothetical protein